LLSKKRRNVSRISFPVQDFVCVCAPVIFLCALAGHVFVCPCRTLCCVSLPGTSSCALAGHVALKSPRLSQTWQSCANVKGADVTGGNERELVGPEGGAPAIFRMCGKHRTLSTCVFGCVAKKRLKERFFGSVARKGVSEISLIFTYDDTTRDTVSQSISEYWNWKERCGRGGLKKEPQKDSSGAKARRRSCIRVGAKAPTS